MKALIIEFRMFLAEWMLAKVFDIAPKGPAGEELRLISFRYFLKLKIK